MIALAAAHVAANPWPGVVGDALIFAFIGFIIWALTR